MVNLMSHRNILFICEGTDDEKLLQCVLKNYNLNVQFQIYKYNTNIHVFAKHLFQNYALSDGELPIEDIDIIQVLKEFRYENILEKKYTDILFVFDFDPQDPRFNVDILMKLMHIFSDSTQLGQLFINYPMVEASIDFETLPDLTYNDKVCTIKDIRFKGYKNSVKKRSVIKHINLICEDQLRIILKQTLDKMKYLTGGESSDYIDLLRVQTQLLLKYQTISIISTCLLFIKDYNTERFLKFIGK